MIRAFSIVFAIALALPAQAQEPPPTFEWTVSYGGTSYQADFELHSARGPNFSVEVQQADGSFVSHTPDSVRTYIGTIATLPGAMASALRREDGSTFYHVLFEDGAEWINNGGTTILRTHDDWTPNYPAFVTGAGGAGSDVWAAEVGVDIPNSQYAVDGDIDAALEMVEHSVNTVNLLYLRDASILHRLGRVVVRADATQDPYDGMTTTGALLSEIGNQWNNVLDPGTHDIALVATFVTGGGLAAVGVVGSPGYSANDASIEGDFTIVWRHEVGHNWSLGHFDGGTPEGKTINSGNSLSRMSGPEQAKAIAHRIARSGFLDNLGPHPFEVPPYASLDRAAYIPQSTAITIDVLGNDHDVNGDSLAITSFDTSTSLGGFVTLSAGTGPGGRDELLYTPPTLATPQTDHFTYRIVDASGREALGNVMTKLTSDSGFLAHFAMDEVAGTVANDSSAYLRHATLENGPNWNPGLINGGIALDGVDDRLTADALDVSTANFTITGWVKRDGDQTGWAGLVFCRGGNTVAGLNFGNANELRYHWDGGQWPWNSGLVVPDGVWTFVALAVTPTAATIYMDPGTGMQTATNTAAHNAEPFDATLVLGHDPHSSPRRFKGEMDDIRIYGDTLSPAEIIAIAAGLGTAANPTPAHLTSAMTSSVELSWTSSPAATNHRVYLSQIYSEVRDGLPTADQGLEPSSAWMTPTLVNGSWFWRIDTTDGTDWAQGPVWSFTIGDADGDELSSAITMGGNTYAGTTTDNTGSTGDDTSCTFNDTIDEWLRWTATVTGIAQASTCNAVTDYDSAIAAFDSAAAAELACNDDAVGAPGECSLGGLNRKSVIQFETVAGETYLIRVSGYNGLTGNYQLTMQNTCSEDLNFDGVVGLSDLLEVLSNWGGDGSDGGDVNIDGSVNLADLLAVLSNWGTC